MSQMFRAYLLINRNIFSVLSLAVAVSVCLFVSSAAAAAWHETEINTTILKADAFSFSSQRDGA